MEEEIKMHNKPIHQLKWAWSVTEGYRGTLLLYFILEVVAIALSLLFVLLSKQAVDLAMQAERVDLERVLLGVVGSLLLALLIRSYAAWALERARLQMNLRLQNQVVDFQMRTVWKLVKDWHSGDLQVRIHADCNEVVGMVAYSALSFVLTLIRLLASFGFLWSLDPMLAFIIVGITPLFLFSKGYVKKMRRLSQQVKQEESNFGKILQENLRFRMWIRSMGLLPLRQKKLEDKQADLYRLNAERLNFSTLTQTAMKLTIHAGYLLTFIWGVFQLNKGQISFGTMTAFLQLVGRVQSPILALIQFVPGFIRFRISVERLMEIARGEREPSLSPQRVNGLQALALQDLTFRYEDQPLFEDLSLRVQVGESAAIVGSSGRGKTTLIRLLLALVEAEKGSIHLVGAQESQQVTAAHRQVFAYVPQGNTLFSGSIRENLRVREGEWEEKRVHRALWLACADFVYALPEGLDTVVGESGHGLSEGQAQRLAIARAMMTDAEIWLFDEITSSLDKQVAAEVTHRLREEGRNKICLFVTHDPQLIASCDQVVYI